MSLEYLKKLAKDRLRELRGQNPHAKLADALLAVAREQGFLSWRALKAEVERQQAARMTLFFGACATGDVDVVREQLAREPALARTTNPQGRYPGWTGLHTAAQQGHLDVVRLLLAHGADPNAREGGDHTYALHWAAARADLELVRALLDAGTDVHGVGDDHAMDVIGWASVFRGPHDPDVTAMDERRRQVVSLLIERGARHHIFSAICVGDLEVIRELVEQNPDALDRRMSRFEHRVTPLHLAINRKRYDILDLLIELGADLEAEDGDGHTALTSAMLRGDREAMQRLQAAGATPPEVSAPDDFQARMTALGASIKKGTPGISVPDITVALDWYASIGFTVVGRYEDNGLVNWGMVALGGVELAFGIKEKPDFAGMSLWFYTDKVEELYRLLKARQLELAQAALAGVATERKGLEFVEDLYDPFYGGRQFSIRDLNGYALVFYHPPGL